VAVLSFVLATAVVVAGFSSGCSTEAGPVDAGGGDSDASHDAATFDSGVVRPIRFMTYNIAFGSISDLAQVASLIADTSPDVVCLQEVDQFQTRSGSVDQLAELSSLLPDLPHQGFTPSVAAGERAVGNAVLSRWPIRSFREFGFEFQRTGAPGRFALFANIEVLRESPPLSFTAICTHMNGGDLPVANEERIEHFKEIEAQARTPRMILAGDFNHTPVRVSYAYSIENWIDVQTVVVPPEPPEGGYTIGTYPSGDKRDFIYLRRPLEWTVLETRIIDDLVTSDHRAVYADLVPVPVAEP